MPMTHEDAEVYFEVIKNGTQRDGAALRGAALPVAAARWLVLVQFVSRIRPYTTNASTYDSRECRSLTRVPDRARLG